MRRLPMLALTALAGPAPALAAAPPIVELHHRLDVSAPAHSRDVALTLDACSGGYDRALIGTLIRLRVPATLFLTRRWLDRNPDALRELLAHAELFELQNHGAAHRPAVVGRSVYGLRGPATVDGVTREVAEGAQAVARAGGREPRWYRGAGAAYDAAGQQAIAQLGEHIAGFSLNADGGATLPATQVARRLRLAQPGQIIIAHMNHPASGTAQGIADALPELLGRGLRFVKLSDAAAVLPVTQDDARR